ncbi:ATP12 family chaperone protein [Novosphingobium sp. 9]|uniref:ATP12 family chaperone protein n=1 Tax=Novosphingobium sp. 9 TaxID=2025349 RepID=UPI0021B6B62A|nr:ATP12 family protein [Novosphingobium sp. 9]
MKRFYTAAAIDQISEGWRVVLDGRPIRTAGGRAQVVPSAALAQALAAEWNAQGETIHPASFRLRDLADFALDVVTDDRAALAQGLLPYAETDTLCYRADPEDALYARQQAVWEPLLARIEADLGVRYTRISGIIHRPQPEETLATLRAKIESEDAFTLAALNMLASLAASLSIALAAIAPDAEAESLWNAANLEEDWQVELWGEDHEATQRRAIRFEAFKLAMDFARLSRS